MTAPPRIILAGAGHAHLAALRRLAKNPLPAEIIFINDGAKAWYTGALPALIRREIPAERACVDVEVLAKSTRAVFINAKMTGFDADHLTLETGVELHFDILAISTGARPNGGVKPIRNFIARLQTWDHAPSPAIGIIGAGPAGVELALALRHRLGPKARIALSAPEAACSPPPRAASSTSPRPPSTAPASLFPPIFPPRWTTSSTLTHPSRPGASEPRCNSKPKITFSPPATAPASQPPSPAPAPSPSARPAPSSPTSTATSLARRC